MQKFNLFLENLGNDYGQRFNLLPPAGNFDQNNENEINERDLGSNEEKFDENKPWTGRWFPNNQEEDSSRMKMGKHPNCDDGKVISRAIYSTNYYGLFVIFNY